MTDTTLDCGKSEAELLATPLRHGSHGGRFDGLTFDEIAEQPRGMDTIRLYAADAKKPTIQREAKKWLDDRAGNQ